MEYSNSTIGKRVLKNLDILAMDGDAELVPA